MTIKQPHIQHLKSFNTNNVWVDVLRLDTIHPIVSGNKWYKLQYYLQDAITKKCSTIVTFGGAYSNHIIATAYACKEFNLKSIGIIRGEKAPTLSHTLQQAKKYEMELHFVSREEFKHKNEIASKLSNDRQYIISEGGYGVLGATGAASILKAVDTISYTHIICACGTGTMLAGIIKSAQAHQTIIGINALKGYELVVNDINSISNTNKDFIVMNNYHFGGYGKHPKDLISWMNTLWQTEQLPTDIVYTAKLFFGTKDLIETNYFSADSKILIIHSGGLQGNLSLPKGTLLF